ncbi:MAG TPA: NAD-dependent epimerase/dehydratase family protein [Candidatus Acutalibacter stercorigallinarum]|nr:NAD-dependent epimerase/dehydratase family protein [Candidatus Acutalibacter stercorigallinarum]
MEKTYLVTGACGHLGGTLVRLLARTGAQVRGLRLPSEQARNRAHVTYYPGDVRDRDSLRPLFRGLAGREVVVFHTAAIVDISGEVTPQMHDVNVNGTKNILALCREYGVKRLVYVSSVHAIPEKDGCAVLREVDRFSPQQVTGGYAKTKAEATQAVLDAAAQGLDAVVVHPSGILGPFDGAENHLVQLVKEYAGGKLPACVKGGYDFVDVRDVAAGCLAAAKKGRSGQCYILSNRHYEVQEVLAMAKTLCHGRRLPVLPMWMAQAAEPLLGWVARVKKQRPLYTKYSLYTLRSNDRFDHGKATAELGYRPRDLRQTVRDTLRWLAKKPVPEV